MSCHFNEWRARISYEVIVVVMVVGLRQLTELQMVKLCLITDIAGSLDALSEPCLQCSMVRSGDAMALGGGQCDQCGVNWAWSSLLAITAAVNYFCSRNCLFLAPTADRFSRRSYYYENVTSGLYLVVIVDCSIYQMLYCWLTKKTISDWEKKNKAIKVTFSGTLWPSSKTKAKYYL